MPEKNFWRVQTILGEERQQKVDAKGDRFATFRAMEKQTLNYAKSAAGVPSFLRASFIDFDHDWSEDTSIMLTIGNSQRRDESNICLPNVSMCDWIVNDQEKSGIGSGRWLDERLRNPLHYAAEKGNLEAVKLLLQHTQISANAVDLDAKTPAELALEKNFYDVYYLFENPAA